MKGILFKPEMVQAIADGRKTVTRRLDGLKEINREPGKWKFAFKSERNHDFTFYHINPDVPQKSVKPRYYPGEIVYVKEVHYAYGRWALFADGWHFNREPLTVIHFVADKNWEHALTKPSSKDAWYKRSPLFLPAKDARSFLQIIDVRPERFNLAALTPEELALEGGTSALKHLLWYDGKWLFRYELKSVPRPEGI